jgi:mono/diheme cytochrome c family protein
MKYWAIHHATIMIIIILCCVFFLGCSENGSNAQNPVASSPTVQASGATPLPDDLQEGEAKFNTFCSRCHGPQGQGTDNGPPLVHKIYEPNHHADMAFQQAAARGVRAHHWKFGNMPKIEGVTSEEVTQIIGYIRWHQRQAGIF